MEFIFLKKNSDFDDLGSARSTERIIKKACPDLSLNVGYGYDYINIISNSKTFAEVDGWSRVRHLESVIETESGEEMRGYVARFCLRYKEVELVKEEKEFFFKSNPQDCSGFAKENWMLRSSGSL